MTRIKPYYGAKAGDDDAASARAHPRRRGPGRRRREGGEQGEAATEQAAWQQNADSIAVFLNKANPDVWKLGEMKTMLIRT